MSRIISGILFFLVFFGAYGGIHYYTFTRLSNFFGLKRSFLFYLTILLLTVSYMIATFIMNRYDSLLTNSLYQAASLWFGIIFLLFWIVIAADILSRITTIPHHTLGMLALSLTLILSTIAIINTRDLKITTYDIEMEGLAEEVRIAHLSDLHIGTIYHADHLERIVSLTNSLNPDIVAITGDLFDSSWHKNGGSMNILNKLHADTYFSTGNHEYYEGIDIIEEEIRKTDVILLRNEAVSSYGLQIIGADDPEFGKSIKEILDTIEITKPAVLLYHQPKGIEDISKKGIGLVLSGHTHNGQIIPFNLITKVFFPMITGIYDYDGTKIHVSPGSSTWGPRMRLGSRNQITLLRLVPEQN